LATLIAFIANYTASLLAQPIPQQWLLHGRDAAFLARSGNDTPGGW
jgi:hypothetical protein